LIIIGNTKNELGGSEYFEYVDKFIGGVCPTVDFKNSKINMLAVLSLIKNKLVKSVHDCSKGGFSIALSELSIFGHVGCDIDIEKIPCEKDLTSEQILFSESHSRYLLVIDKKNILNVERFLSKKKISFAVLGKFSGDQINIKRKSQNLVKLKIDLAQKRYFNGLGDLLNHG
jgi:phosphoribosylformylglycinamidine synthase